MKIENIRIKNWRSFSDVKIPLNDYTCLVGPNGAGKSNVLSALNVFFRETENVATNMCQLTDEDFHQKMTDEPIEITVTFTDLSREAEADFADYYRQGKLVITAIATFDKETGKADVKQMGQRLGMDAFKDFFRAVGDRKSVAELKELYIKIRATLGELPAPGSKDSMIATLHEYENNHQDQCVLIPSEDQFYGVSKGSSRLNKYIQWIFVPAVKDVTSEQIESKNTALGKLLARTVRSKVNFGNSIKELQNDTLKKYHDLLEESQSALDDISQTGH